MFFPLSPLLFRVTQFGAKVMATPFFTISIRIWLNKHVCCQKFSQNNLLKASTCEQKSKGIHQRGAKNTGK